MTVPIQLMIIDDKLENWIALLKCLRRSSDVIQVTSAHTSVFYGLPLLEQGGVEVVLVGAGMPPYEGIPCARFLKLRRPRLAIILTGGQGSEAERKKAMVTHGCPRLFQPFRAEELVKIVHLVIRKASLRIWRTSKERWFIYRIPMI